MARKSQPREVPVRTMMFKVAGVSFSNRDGTPRQELIRLYAGPGVPIALVREQGNSHSPTAVAVRVRRFGIGFVPEEYSSRVANYLDRDYRWTARILDVYGGETEKPTIGVTIEAAFWRGKKPGRDPIRAGYEKNNLARLANGAPALDIPRTRVAEPLLSPGVRAPLVFVFLFAAASIAAVYLYTKW